MEHLYISSTDSEPVLTYNVDDSDRLRIGVIGAGASGLSAIKALKDLQQVRSGLWDVVAFEERDDIGGVWLPSNPASDPFGKDQRSLEPPMTPLYDSLTTNLPHPVMCYQSYLFPPETPLFPPASTVETYLRDFARHFDLTPQIHLNAKVVDAKWSSELEVWSVTAVHKLKGGNEFTKGADTQETVTESERITQYEFDRLIITNGHYRVPRYPNVPGVEEWLRTGRAWHSAWYRSHTDPRYKDRVIAIVGDGPSGQDISTELLTVARTVIHCVPGAISVDECSSINGRIQSLKRRGRVVGFADNGKIEFEDGSFEVEVDYCLIATGYKMDFSFFSGDMIRDGIPPAIPPLPSHFYNSSYHVFPLAKQLFPLQTDCPPWSVAFLGLLVRVAPFPLYEAQMKAVIKVFEDPASLDVTAEAVELVARYERLRSQAGDGSEDVIARKIAIAWHRYPEGEAYDYRDEMHRFAGLEGPQWMSPLWAKEIYGKKAELRKMWVALERKGEAERWLKGVGYSGDVQEWVDLMRKILDTESIDSTNQAKL